MKYLRSAIFHFNFGAILGISHLALVIANTFGGYKALMKIYALYNYLIASNLKTLGTKLQFINEQYIPTDRPIILVANHQSTFDIPTMIWHFREHHVKFVAKSELAKGYPCISYTLRNNGSVFADRKRPKEALAKIGELGNHISQNNYAAVIFPEGRRNRKKIKFRERGIKTLIENTNNALIVPIAISGLWQVELSWPMQTNKNIQFEVLQPIEVGNRNLEILINEVEELIEAQIIDVP